MTDLKALIEFKTDLLAFYDLTLDRIDEEIDEIKGGGSEPLLRQKLIESLEKQKQDVQNKVKRLNKVGA